jgi:hypothetical protein
MPTTVPMHPRKMSMPVPTSSAKAICRTCAREWGPNNESSTPISRFNPANNAMVSISWRYLQNTCMHLIIERSWRPHEPLISWQLTYAHERCQTVHTAVPYHSRDGVSMETNTGECTPCSDGMYVLTDFLVVTAGLRMKGNMAGGMRLVKYSCKQSADSE